jgi:Uma2 family endonuclease
MTAAVAHPSHVPPLENGDRLSRQEFERRYRAMPRTKKAELIEGVVYMPSPVRLTKHGRPHIQLAAWLAYYISKTPGLNEFGDNATIRLDNDNEPQPDLILLLPQSAGGQARIDKDDYVVGAPEFVAEVAASSVSIDLHDKLNAYLRNRVQEYLVWRTEDLAIDYLILRDGQYAPIQLDPSGILKSETFPGLWLDPQALLRGDLARLFAVIDQGVATPEHASFLERLKAV